MPLFYKTNPGKKIVLFEYSFDNELFPNLYWNVFSFNTLDTLFLYIMR